MPQKEDPCATPRAKYVDLTLCLLAILLLLIVLLTSPRFRHGHSRHERHSHAGEVAAH